MERTYSDFQKHYRNLPTQELLRIRLTTDLVPEARLALDAELDDRSDEIAADPPKLYLGPPTRSTPRSLKVLLWIALALAGVLFPVVLPYWSKFLDWLTQ